MKKAPAYLNLSFIFEYGICMAVQFVSRVNIAAIFMQLYLRIDRQRKEILSGAAALME